MNDPTAPDRSDGAEPKPRETRRAWWARVALRASQPRPRLGDALQKLGAVLLVSWPLVLMLAILILQNRISTDLNRRLDEFGDRHPLLALLSAVALILLLMQWASYLFFRMTYLGRQLKAARQASSFQTTTDRPPVVYLRPFSADVAARPRFRERTAVVGANVLASIEEQLADVVAPIGPLLAIGAPGEELPTPGAVRLYARDDQWKSMVDDWLRKARLVIIRPGQSEGLLWELKEVFSTTRPTRVLILAIDLGAHQYSAFSASLRERLGIELPAFNAVSRWRRVSGFFQFDQTWHAQFLPLEAPWHRDSPWVPMKARLNHSLQPVFAQLGVPWRPSPVSRWKVLLAALFVFTLVFAALASALR